MFLVGNAQFSSTGDLLTIPVVFYELERCICYVCESSSKNSNTSINGGYFVYLIILFVFLYRHIIVKAANK